MNHKTESPKASTRPVPTIAWCGLIRCIVAILLTIKAAQLALYLGRWPLPIRYGSLVALVVGLGLSVYGLLGLRRWVRTLTLRRAIIIGIAVYLISVLVVGLIRMDESGPIPSFLNAATQVPIAVGQWIANSSLAVMRFPGQMWTAYTGETPAMGIPRADDAPVEPVIANDPTGDSTIMSPPTNLPQPSSITLGDEAVATAQAAALCQMSALADEPFPPGVRVTIVEGPRIRDDGIWWRVQNETGSGWCPAAALTE